MRSSTARCHSSPQWEGLAAVEVRKRHASAGQVHRREGGSSRRSPWSGARHGHSADLDFAYAEPRSRYHIVEPVNTGRAAPPLLSIARAYGVYRALSSCWGCECHRATAGAFRTRLPLTRRLGSLLCPRDVGPTREAVVHLLAVQSRGPSVPPPTAHGMVLCHQWVLRRGDTLQGKRERSWYNPCEQGTPWRY